LAALIAIPVSYFILHQRLQEFAYQLQLSPLLFLIPLLALGLIIFVIVAYYSFQINKLSPVRTLRDE
jgi:ABC-type antimicrobial peptide transport system permease subunit